jgi:hypothetical protein
VTPVADPFMAGHEPPTRRPGDFTRTKQGTPVVSVPDGHLVKPKRKADPPRIATTPYGRPSGFGKIIEDMYSIHKWDQRQQVYGFAVLPELVERAGILLAIEDRESQEWKDEADKIVKAAKIAAKSSLAADRGTHAHELTEDDDEGRDIIARIEAGEELGLAPEVQRSLVAAWREMLERDRLEILAVEMPVVNDTYRGAGTLDRVGRLLAPLRFRLVTGEIIELPAGWTGILDVKSGKRRLRNDGTVMYWHGYAVQVFLYANGVPYDTETDTRGKWKWKIDQRWALIAHLDVLSAIDGEPSCDLILVDLVAGRRAADLCVAAKAWGNESTVFSVAQIVEGAVSGVAGEATSMATAPAPSTFPDGDTPFPSSGTGEVEACGKPPDTSPVESRVRLSINGRPYTDHTYYLRDGATAATIDQGADLSAPEYELLWAKIRHEHDALPDLQREWVNRLSTQARQAGVTFHTRQVQTERSYHLCKALVTVAAGGGHEGIIDALMLNFPLEQTHKTRGHMVGSLNCLQAERLAALSDEWATTPVPA